MNAETPAASTRDVPVASTRDSAAFRERERVLDASRQATTLRDYSKRLREAGDALRFHLDADRVGVDLALPAVRAFGSHFAEWDRVVLHVTCGAPDRQGELQAALQEAARHNVFRSCPHVVWNGRVGPSPVDVAAALAAEPALPAWVVLYGHYQRACDTLPFYEREVIVERYDTVKYLESGRADPETGTGLSTFTGGYEEDFLDMVEALGVTSVMDLGCGAGAFFHLLESIHGDRIAYRGVDYSRGQIAAAIRNFGTHFAVADIARMDREELAGFDAVHCYSVLNFMAPADQLRVLDALLASGTKVFLEFSATVPRPDFVPASIYRHLSALDVHGRRLWTPIGFPLLDEVLDLVASHGDRHMVEWSPSTYGNSRFCNARRDGEPVLLDDDQLKREPQRKAWLRENGFESRLASVLLRIVPTEWAERRGARPVAVEDEAEERKRVFARLSARLRPRDAGR